MTMQLRTTLGLFSDVQLNIISMPDPLNATGGYDLNPKQFYALEDFLARKNDLFDVRKIQTKDNSNACLALCIGIRVYEPLPDIKRASWYRNRAKRKLPAEIDNLTKNIYSVLEMDYNSLILPTLHNFKKIQNWLSEKHYYNLKVYKVCGEKIRDSFLIFEGNTNHTACISLLIYKSHCFLICSEKILSSQKTSICKKCSKIHPRATNCSLSACKFCHSESCTLLYPQVDELRRLKCDHCFRFFKNDYCFG